MQRREILEQRGIGTGAFLGALLRCRWAARNARYEAEARRQFGELAARFRAAGFAGVGVRPRLKGRALPCPAWAMRDAEGVLGLFPYGLRKKMGRSPVLRPLFAVVTVVGRKAARG